MRLSTIIVSYHSNAVLSECITALDARVRELAESHPVECQTIVVANSPADTPELWRSEIGTTTILRADHNPGFSPSVNLALRHCQDNVDYILLLNPDALLLPGCLSKLVAEAETSHAALVGPVFCDADGFPRGLSERPFHSLRREVGRQLFGTVRMTRSYGVAAMVTGNARCLTGACLLARADFLFRVGGLTEDLPMYLEDVLLCWQAHQRRAGVKLAWRARCRHVMGQSAGGVNFDSEYGLALMLLASRIRFIELTSGRRQAVAMRGIMAIGAASRALCLPDARRRHLRTLRWAVSSGKPPAWDAGPVLNW